MLKTVVRIRQGLWILKKNVNLSGGIQSLILMSCIVLYVAELVVFTLFKCLSDTNQSNGKASGIIDDTHQGSTAMIYKKSLK